MLKPSVPASFVAKWLALSLLAWSLLAAIPTSSAYLAVGSGGLALWLRFYSFIGPYYYLWALASLLVYRLSIGPLHPDRGLVRCTLGHLLLFGALSFGLGYIVHFEQWRLWLVGEYAPGYHAMSAFSYLFILLGIYLFRLHVRVRQQEAIISEQRQRELELQASLAQAQIDALRGQMNPHFLFNALNCIGALIETQKNNQAYAALENLGSLLRSSLEHGSLAVTTLANEMEFVRNYIALEQMRFGARLEFSTDMDEKFRQWPVPPFILQPLIENAIKHAVAPSKDAVSIRVAAEQTSSGLVLSVTDTGQVKRKTEGPGVGLDNLRRRLGLIYGDAARLDLQQDDSGTRVYLTIPATNPSTPKENPATGKAALAARTLQLQH